MCFSPDLFLATKKWHDLACVPDVLCLSRTPLLLQLGHPRKRADKTTDTGPTEQLPGSPASEGHRLLDVRVTAENSAFESYRVRNTSGWLSFSTLLSRPKDPEQPLELPWAMSQGPLPGPRNGAVRFCSLFTLGAGGVRGGGAWACWHCSFPFHLSNERV